MRPGEPPPTIGIMLPIGYGIEPHDLVELAVTAEGHGLDAVGTGEFASTEAFALLGALAQATEGIRLEAAVVSIATRSPALLAMAANTVAALSGNRFVLGIGAGSPIVSSFHGEVFERPLDRVAETLIDVKAVLAGGSIEGTGGFKLRGVEARAVPVFVSAMNDRMFKLAAREADGVVIQFVGPRQVAELVPTLRAERAAAGNDSPFEIVALIHAAADHDGDPESVYRREMAPYLAVPTYRNSAIALSSVEEVDAATEAWKTGGRDAAAAAFPSTIVEAGLAIGGDALAARIADLLDAGCTGVRFVPVSVGGDDASPAFGLVERIAEVMTDRLHQEARP